MSPPPKLPKDGEDTAAVAESETAPGTDVGIAAEAVAAPTPHDMPRSPIETVSTVQLELLHDKLLANVKINLDAGEVDRGVEIMDEADVLHERLAARKQETAANAQAAAGAASASDGQKTAKAVAAELPTAGQGRTPAVAEGGAASASDGAKADGNATAGDPDINDGFADGCQRVAEDVPNAKRQKKAASAAAKAPAASAIGSGTQGSSETETQEEYQEQPEEEGSINESSPSLDCREAQQVGKGKQGEVKGKGKQKGKEKGKGEKNVTGCWIATDAYTGIPLDNQYSLYIEVQDDLGYALAHRYDE